MNCPNCGNELNETQNFCTKCGTKIEIGEPVSEVYENKTGKKLSPQLLFTIIFLATFALIALIICLVHHFEYADVTIGEEAVQQQEVKQKLPVQQEENTNKDSIYADKLKMIEEYQASYFKIVKRNDVLLHWEDDEIYNKDRKELEALFKEVKNKITNKHYLMKYDEIEERFAENPGETTVDMNIFASQNYDAADALLNEVYQAVKKKIPPEDFKNLTASEIKWIKDVENYKKVFDSQGFGTIGKLVYYDYEINMRNFRTLLLMLYL